MNAAGIGLWEIDIPTDKVFWDDRCCELAGIDHQNALLYEEAFRYIHPKDAAWVLETIRAALQGEQSGQLDATFRIARPHKAITWINLTGTAYFDEVGQATRFGGVARDVTEAQTASQKIAERQQQLLALFKQAPVAIGVLSRHDLTILSANQFYLDLIDRTSVQAIGKPLLEALPEVAGQGFDTQMQEVINTGIPYEINEIPADLMRNGRLETVYMNLSYQPMREADGSISGVLVVALDVTSGVLARQKIKESEAFRELLGDSVPAMIFYLDAEQRYTLYNETFRQWFSVAGADAIGKTVREFIGEAAYSSVSAALEKAYGGERVQFEMPAPTRIDPNRWLNVMYTPHETGAGDVVGVIVHATDITGVKMAAMALQASEARFRAVIEEAPIAATLFTGPGLVVEVANELTLKYWGKDPGIIGKPLAEAAPELVDQQMVQLLQRIYQEGGMQSFQEMPITFIENGRQKTGYYTHTMKALYDATGKVEGVIAVGNDVTEQVKSRQALEENAATLRAIINNAPSSISIAIFLGRELIVEAPNQAFLDTVGKGNDIAGKPFAQVMPELEDQPFLRIIDDAYTSGETFYSFETPATIIKNGIPVLRYFNISFTPLKDIKGETYAVLDISVDVTENVETRKTVEENAAKLRAIVDNAQAAIGVYAGKDMIVEHPNQAFIDIVGKGPDIAGKPLREVMPELLSEGQPFLKILDDVYTTGIPYVTSGSLIKIVRGDEMTNGYYNFSYTPVLDLDGQVYQIVVVATDVTEQIAARRAAEEANEALRGATDLAELGNWSLDMTTGILEYSERMRSWFGFEPDELITIDVAYSVIKESDRHLVRESMQAAIAPGSDSLYDAEYTAVNRRTGREHIIHAQGSVSLNEEGQAYRVIGTAQDITIYRQLQFELEHQVQQRTEELEAAVEELKTTNDELEKSNAQLVHSNDELAQYAYVASHDLQEPLRKIRVFAGMLAGSSELSADTKLTIEKISGAAERMSMLIQDLLSFSRLLKSETLIRPVSLQETVEAVWGDFELIVKEKGATIKADGLPVILAVSLQMNQLFYNLINNALKFTAPGQSPHIEVTSALITREEAHKNVPKPLPSGNYYHISVSDNGIGFETQYYEQIFEVFKRLHGRDHYQGSGIGLSLCRRIVTNHNGHIYAESKPGKGSVFHIFLPDRQHDIASVSDDEETMIPSPIG